METKKSIVCCLCLLLPLLTAGCAANSTANHIAAQNNGVAQLLEPTEAAVTGALSPVARSEAAGEEDVDLDISENSNIAYSELYMMMSEPEEFVGMTVRMRGLFRASEDPSTGRIIYGCVIMDPTACCTQGLEFEPAEDLSYPSDFPPLDSEITVVGEFTTYMENDYQYCALKNATLTY